MEAWTSTEVASSDMRDARLDARFEILLDRLAQRPSASLPQACCDHGELLAAYRFFDNSKVSPEKILEPHRQATAARIRDYPVVVIPQDTTVVDTTRPEEQVEGAGPLGDEAHTGFLAHLSVAFTPEKVPLGVIEAELWARDSQTFRSTEQRRQKPIEDKESHRWIRSYHEACAIAQEAPETQIVSVADSEGDIFEWFAEVARRSEGARASVIVRACQNRRARGEAETEPNKLWEQALGSPVVGEVELMIRPNHPSAGQKGPRHQPRSQRHARATVQTARVSLSPPNRKGGSRSAVEMNAVVVHEQNPPEGEAPVEWLLLTDLPVDDWEQIERVLQYYACRWQIEIYFRVLKQGCRIEELQLETADRFLPCLALYLIVAWRVLIVTMLGRECPELACDAVFSEEEWKAVYAVTWSEAPPETPPSLGSMVEWVARLGGYLGRRSDGPPGAQTVWIGLQRLRDLAIGWRAFGTFGSMAPRAP